MSFKNKAGLFLIFSATDNDIQQLTYDTRYLLLLKYYINKLQFINGTYAMQSIKVATSGADFKINILLSALL